MNIVFYIGYAFCIIMLLLFCRTTLINGMLENNLKNRKEQPGWTPEDEANLAETKKKRKRGLTMCILCLITSLLLLTIIAYK